MNSIATSIPEADTASDHPLLDVMLSRQSMGVLREPAPTQQELDLILDVALRAPDHGRMRPWRFVLIRGEARKTYADFLVEAVKKREGNVPDGALQKIRRILDIPLIIAVGAKVKTEERGIPEIEQLLSTGAAAMNMLNAIHAMGYGAKWVTGGNAYDRNVNEALGFTWPDRIVGFLYVGTLPPNMMPAQPRPSRADHVKDWTGPVAG